MIGCGCYLAVAAFFAFMRAGRKTFSAKNRCMFGVGNMENQPLTGEGRHNFLQKE